MENVFYFSLINGYDLVCNVLSENDEYVMITNAFRVHRGFTDGGEYSILTKLVPYQNNEIKLDRKNIVFKTTVEAEELKNLYKEYIAEDVKEGFSDELEELINETGTFH